MDALWAWVTEDKDGRIHLVAVVLPGLGTTPLISHDRETVTRTESLAKAHGAAMGQPVWLRRYLVACEVGRIIATLDPTNVN